jgi:hypothetical protein
VSHSCPLKLDEGSRLIWNATVLIKASPVGAFDPRG